MPVALPSTSLTQKQAVENPGALKTRAGTSFYELLLLHVSPSISNDGHLQAELGVKGVGWKRLESRWRSNQRYVHRRIRSGFHTSVPKERACSGQIRTLQFACLRRNPSSQHQTKKKKKNACPLLQTMESHCSAFSFLQLPLFLRNQHSK